MFTYSQRAGTLLHNGILIGSGYSGHGDGKNDPDFQNIANVGPIPRGKYRIGGPEDLQGGPHGPYVLPLRPDPENEMFGRSGFLIHGDEIAHPGEASFGCIIMAREIREAITRWGDSDLEVIE
ncbi:MAG TPA: tlde1 domain-containing protein [Bryobacteraceae bacterium]|nr:tlde1 domain-containing protein [Bryobacteraceae bacterium]